MGFLDKLFGASKKKKVHHHQNDEVSFLGSNEKNTLQRRINFN